MKKAEKESELIDLMKQKGLGRLEPVPDRKVRLGYVYPAVAEFFGVRDGSEIRQLEALADAKVLERDVFDAFCICSHCRDYRVRIGEECKSCEGAHLRRVNLIHHYRCAWIAPETDFLKGRDLICPKCRRLLDQIGVDYDRPGRFYLCSACSRRYPEDGLEARCDACKSRMPADELPAETVYAYGLPVKKDGRP